MEFAESLVIAIGAAGLLAATAFRQLTTSLINLNRELRIAVEERRANQVAYDVLQAKVDQLEAKIQAQQHEIQLLKTSLRQRDETIQNLRAMTRTIH